jgi:regulator of PEP synthase PpsR (kinase-PPPase family)
MSEADVVLVGVSRSSKTPTCFYLANRGIKAANIPLVPGIEPPELLKDPPCPVIGLTIDPRSLIDIRRHRLKLIGAGAQPGFAAKDNGDYVDFEAVEKELLWAKRLCTARHWPIIDVTRRSIEETAATVLKLMESWHAKHEKKESSSFSEEKEPKRLL